MRWAIFLPLLFLFSCHSVTVQDNLRQEKKRQAALSNIQLGIQYLQQNDKPRAKRKLLKAMRLAPNSAKVHAAWAFYWETTGNRQLAQSYYQKALALSPKSGAELSNYAAFLCREKKYKEAEQYFLQAFKDVHYVNLASAYENAGICAERYKDYKKATAYLTKALLEDASRTQALYVLLQIEMKFNQIKEAKRDVHRYQDLVQKDVQLQKLALMVEQKPVE